MTPQEAEKCKWNVFDLTKGKHAESLSVVLTSDFQFGHTMNFLFANLDTSN